MRKERGVVIDVSDDEFEYEEEESDEAEWKCVKLQVTMCCGDPVKDWEWDG